MVVSPAKYRGARATLLRMMRIGGHFHSDNPLEDAVACGAQTAQFFLGDPQGWKGPVIPGGDPAALADSYAAADVDIYIHAPYVIKRGVHQQPHPHPQQEAPRPAAQGGGLDRGK